MLFISYVENEIYQISGIFFFKVSQYKKYKQTNIRIHFINNKLTNTYLLVTFLWKKYMLQTSDQEFGFISIKLRSQCFLVTLLYNNVLYNEYTFICT